MTFDGHTYAVVGIGDQCWFKENLRLTHYLKGDPIPGNLSNGEWTSTAPGAQAVYNENPANLAAYGRLYNWYAVNDARGLCPSGFHVPSDVEWMELEMALGMPEQVVQLPNRRGTNEGAKMKASPGENPGWNGSNESGFTGLPSGLRHYEGYNFIDVGTHGAWWSPTAIGPNAFVRYLVSWFPKVDRYVGNPRNGFSVRCMKN